MSEYDNGHLGALRAALLDHPVYAQVGSVADLRRFMQDHVFAVWDFVSLLKRLQQDMTCIKVPCFPADNARAAGLINDIVLRVARVYRRVARATERRTFAWRGSGAGELYEMDASAGERGGDDSTAA